MAAIGDIDVDCMKRDCKWNEEAKCRAARILIGNGPECQTYEPDASAAMALLGMAGALGGPPAGGTAPGPAPAPAARPMTAAGATPPGGRRPAAAPSGRPGPLLQLLAGGGGPR